MINANENMKPLRLREGIEQCDEVINTSYIFFREMQ